MFSSTTVHSYSDIIINNKADLWGVRKVSFVVPTSSNFTTPIIPLAVGTLISEDKFEQKDIVMRCLVHISWWGGGGIYFSTCLYGHSGYLLYLHIRKETSFIYVVRLGIDHWKLSTASAVHLCIRNLFFCIVPGQNGAHQHRSANS